MNICIAFSPDWADYVAVELYAIFKTNPAPTNTFLSSIYLITDDQQALIKLGNVCDKFNSGYCIIYCNWKEYFPSLIYSELNIDNRFTKYTLYRLLLPNFGCDKILYLDADTIVNGDLSELWNTDLGNNLIAGVRDSGVYTQQYHYVLDNLGLNDNDTYINAGVMLMDLDKIRAAQLCVQWVEMINKTWYSAHDQDIINLTCRGRIKLVENKYNISVSTGLNVTPENKKIVHFAGASDVKPWNNEDAPNAHIWRYWANHYQDEVLK